LTQSTKTEATAAYHEANDVNRKIATLTGLLTSAVENREGPTTGGVVLNRVDKTTQETLERVKQADP
jgi:hypothetical protein